MANVDDKLEEILDWAEEPDQKLLENLGRKLADDEPLGFSGSGFSDQSTSASNASIWLDENTQEIVEAFDRSNELGDVKLARELANVLSSSFPTLPLGPLSLLVARRIVKRRSEVNEASKMEGVTEERSYRVSEDSNIDGALASIFSRADELAHANKGGNLPKGTSKKEQITVRLDSEVVDWLKAKGPRHNARINGMLRALMEHEDNEPS